MYTRTLRKADHERRFSIVDAGASGWEVRHEQDQHIVKRMRYDDWHCLERARMAIAAEAEILKDSGWNELAPKKARARVASRGDDGYSTKR